MLPREATDALGRACRTFPAILLVGPRQSGKTTLLRSGWGQSHRFVSLENPDLRARALADPAGFLRDNPPPVILDEIQYAPDFLSYIKTSIDEDRTPGRWLLTGSQNFPVMQGVSQSLAGRVAVMTLLPLTIAETMENPRGGTGMSELLDAVFNREWQRRPPALDLANWLLRGAYPEPRANPEVDRALWCASYVQTYLERDVRQLLNVGDLNAFERFLRLVAARTGQILNFSDLARDTGVSQPTAKAWMSVLEASGQVYLLHPHFRNLGKRLIKSPKVYWLDTGIATFLMGLHTAQPTVQGPFVGALLETAVVSAWVKAFHNRGLPPSLYYWRSSDGIEVDIVIEYDGCLYPIEVKATSTVTPGHASSLTRWLSLAGANSRGGLVVADIAEPMSIVPNVRAIPWWWI